MVDNVIYSKSFYFTPNCISLPNVDKIINFWENKEKIMKERCNIMSNVEILQVALQIIYLDNCLEVNNEKFNIFYKGE